MRFLVKVSFPVESGNAAAKKDGFQALPMAVGAPAF